MMDIEIKTVTIDGKPLAYTNQTVFLVQIGKNRGAYRTKWSFKGDPFRAAKYYRGLNVGLGYKKRLLMPSAKHPVLARQIT